MGDVGASGGTIDTATPPKLTEPLVLVPLGRTETAIGGADGLPKRKLPRPIEGARREAGALNASATVAALAATKPNRVMLQRVVGAGKWGKGKGEKDVRIAKAGLGGNQQRIGWRGGGGGGEG